MRHCDRYFRNSAIGWSFTKAARPTEDSKLLLKYRPVLWTCRNKFFLNYLKIINITLNPTREFPSYYEYCIAGQKPEAWLIRSYTQVVRQLKKKSWSYLLFQYYSTMPKMKFNIDKVSHVGLANLQFGKSFTWVTYVQEQFVHINLLTSFVIIVDKSSLSHLTFHRNINFRHVHTLPCANNNWLGLTLWQML